MYLHSVAGSLAAYSLIAMPAFPPEPDRTDLYTTSPWTDELTGIKWLFTSAKVRWSRVFTGAGSGGGFTESETAPLDKTVPWFRPSTNVYSVWDEEQGAWVSTGPAASDESPYHIDAPTAVVPVSAGVATVDMARSSAFTLALSQNVTLAVTNRLRGTCVVYVTQGGGFNITLTNTFRTLNGLPISLSPDAGDVDVLTLVCDGTNVFVSAAPNWVSPVAIASPYLAETLDYMERSGASPSIIGNLDNWIRGLKLLGAWNSASMWILRADYQGPGEVVHGLGGNPKIAQVRLGAGSVTKADAEYIFTKTGAQVRVLGENLLPLTPLMSVLMVCRNSGEVRTHLGAGFGGERNTAGFTNYDNWRLSNVNTLNTLYFAANDAAGYGSGDTPDSTRYSIMMTLSGEQAGNSSVNGAAPVAASPGGANYTSMTRSAETTVAGNPTFGMPAGSAYSFSCLWTTNQSANAAAIHNLFTTTIGVGLITP